MRNPDIYIQVLQEEHPEIILALAHHRTHKNKEITFKDLNYLKGLYTDKSDKIVVQKGTQMRISEWLVQKGIYKAMKGRAVFYVLPTWEMKNRVVKDRFDRSIMYTPYYQRIIRSGMHDKQAESSSLKHILNGSITFVGSNTPVAFISTPADVLIIDERDSCNQENLIMAKERLGASDNPEEIQVGNPTIPNFGITEEYENSDKKQWVVKCSNCGKYIFFDFFKHVVKYTTEYCYVLDENWTRLDNNLNPICDKCNKPFDRFVDGEWIAENKNIIISGYRIGKEFSPTSSLTQLVQNFSRGLLNDGEMQRFYNSDLGLPYISKGAKIDESILDDCIDNYNLPDGCVNTCVAGVDVGSVFHVTIGEIIPDKIKLVYINSLQNPEDIIDVFRRYNVKCFVVDAMPETRISKRLILSHKVGFMCYYSDAKGDMTVEKTRRIVNANRTASLDGIKEMLLTKTIILPQNARSIQDFYSHMTCSIRVYSEDKNRYDWVHGNAPDHYFHAFNYMLLARRLLMMAT